MIRENFLSPWRVLVPVLLILSLVTASAGAGLAPEARLAPSLAGATPSPDAPACTGCAGDVEGCYYEIDTSTGEELSWGSLGFVKNQDGECNPNCSQKQPCKYTFHYEVGTKIADGYTQFFANDSPPTYSIEILGYNAIQGSRVLEVNCAAGNSSRIRFIQLAPPLHLAWVDVFGECGDCTEG